MTDAKVNRDSLIQEAIKRGYSEDQVLRAPAYHILKMLNEDEKDKERKKIHRRHHHHSRAEDLAAQQIHGDLEVRGEEDDEDDDSRTVVDMSHITQHANPSDQKFARFQFLIKAKETLIAAINKNTTLLQSRLQYLDGDDVLAMKNEIEGAQKKLQETTVEMQELYQSLVEIQAERQALYESLLADSTDLSGNLRNHFHQKLQNIKDYIKAMNAPSISEPKETPKSS